MKTLDLPLELALACFKKKPYTPEFFDSLAVYRETLSHTKQTATQMLRVEIDLILWQDLQVKRTHPCWSDRICRGALAVDADEGALWRALFQAFHCRVTASPSKRWFGRAQKAFAAIGRERFAERLRSWIQCGEDSVNDLTAPGSYVLKNLIWMTPFASSPGLENAWHSTACTAWRRKPLADKVAVASAYMWTRPAPHHEPGMVVRRLDELVSAHPDYRIAQLRTSYLEAIRS